MSFELESGPLIHSLMKGSNLLPRKRLDAILAAIDLVGHQVDGLLYEDLFGFERSVSSRVPDDASVWPCQ